MATRARVRQPQASGSILQALSQQGLDPETAAAAWSVYVHDPVAFAADVIEVELDGWQQDTLRALAEFPRVSVRSGHGVGKSCLESVAAWWFLATRQRSRVVATAPTYPQLMDVLWPELSKWMAQSALLKAWFEWTKTRIYSYEDPELWWATARTSNKPENLQGFHADSLLFLVDEASGVAEEIYEPIEGALTGPDNRLLLCGNPTQISGTFYQSFNRDRRLYWTKRVSCFDSPRVSPQYAERIAAKYGIGSDVYRVRVLGEFPKAEPDVLIPLPLVEAALVREAHLPDIVPVIRLGVDVARFGDDETVLAPKVADRILPLVTRRGIDTMETTGLCLETILPLMEQYHAERGEIVVDDTGVGGGVTDRLREIVAERRLPLTVYQANNGAKATDPEQYANWGSEAWHGLKKLLEAKALTLPDSEDKDDEADLVGQLTTRKYKLTSDDRIRLESKDDMKRRGLASPDRADAVVLACAGLEVLPMLLPEFNPAVHVAEPFPLESHWPRWMSIFPETAGGTMSVLMLTVVPSGEIVVYDELIGRWTVQELAMRIRRMIGPDPIVETLLAPYAWKADPLTGERWAERFHEAGLSVVEAPNDSARGIFELRNLFKADPRRGQRITIFDTCPGLLSDLTSAREEEVERPQLANFWRLILRNLSYRDMRQYDAPLDLPDPDVP